MFGGQVLGLPHVINIYIYIMNKIFVSLRVKFRVFEGLGKTEI